MVYIALIFVRIFINISAWTCQSVMAQHALGIAKIRDDPAAAATHFVECLKHDPQYALAHVSYGNFLLKNLNLVKDAQRHFQLALNAWPNFNMAAVQLRRTTRLASKLDKASESKTVDMLGGAETHSIINRLEFLKLCEERITLDVAIQRLRMRAEDYEGDGQCLWCSFFCVCFMQSRSKLKS